MVPKRPASFTRHEFGKILDPQERFLRFYRWNMVVLFVLVVLCGATLVSSAVWPSSATAQWLGRTPA